MPPAWLRVTLTLNPTSLRKDSDTLAQLREKMFVLWGDLEERKSKCITEKMEFEKRRRVKERMDLERQSLKRKISAQEQGGKRTKAYGASERVDEEGENGDGKEELPLITGRGKLFEAYVKEYGVKRREEDGGTRWERMFMLHGVTIE